MLADHAARPSWPTMRGVRRGGAGRRARVLMVGLLRARARPWRAAPSPISMTVTPISVSSCSVAPFIDAWSICDLASVNALFFVMYSCTLVMMSCLAYVRASGAPTIVTLRMIAPGGKVSPL